MLMFQYNRDHTKALERDNLFLKNESPSRITSCDDLSTSKDIAKALIKYNIVVAIIFQIANNIHRKNEKTKK